MSDNERAAQAVAMAVAGLAVYETLIQPGVATGLLPAVTALLQALASVVAALREK